MRTTPRSFVMLALAKARKLVNVAVALTVMLASVGPAQADRDADGDDGLESYSIGLWGDLPYSPVQSSAGVPNLIADMMPTR